MKKQFITEATRLQKLAGIITENQGPSGYERLYAKVDNLDRNTQVNAYQLLDFVNNLGGNTEDEMVIDAIFYAAQDNNADELICLITYNN